MFAGQYTLSRCLRIKANIESAHTGIPEEFRATIPFLHEKMLALFSPPHTYAVEFADPDTRL